MTFAKKLDTCVSKNNSLVCVGLDSDGEKIPLHIRRVPYAQFVFNQNIIDATYHLVCAYKLNSAFYEAYGEAGIHALKMTCDYLNTKYPNIPVILDAKRADIGNTNNGYVNFAFDYLGVDAITLHPYLGREALQPFLDRKDKGCIILCKTSNSGAGELQDVKVYGQPLYKLVAEHVAKEWNNNNNCLLVVGATYPEEIKHVRKIVGDLTILVPGIGAQGGDLKKTLNAGLTKQKRGLIINSSRGIIFASNGKDFAKKAGIESEKLRNAINMYRIF